MPDPQLSKTKKRVFALSTALIALSISIILGELLIGILSPQQTMSPRREFSPEYGFMNYKNTRTVHEVRGRWRFVYTTNHYRNRGDPLSISNQYDVPNIVILGDSYSFGLGVNDGEEYAAIMASTLKHKYHVINLSVAGWGLTQQIRRFYEFGQLYSPQIVLLQFCINDLDDNFNNQVTVIENGKFRFIASKSNINWIKKYLSDSVIQHSQIYNLIRDSIYTYFAQKHIRSEVQRQSITQGLDGGDPPLREKSYNDLLELFAKDLSRRGTRFLMVSVNGQLDQASHVKTKVFDLETKGLLHYIEVSDFFAHGVDYSSPEGHAWGQRAHRIIGERLSEIISSDGIYRGLSQKVGAGS